MYVRPHSLEPRWSKQNVRGSRRERPRLPGQLLADSVFLGVAASLQSPPPSPQGPSLGVILCGMGHCSLDFGPTQTLGRAQLEILLIYIFSKGGHVRGSQGLGCGYIWGGHHSTLYNLFNFAQAIPQTFI